MYIRNNKLIKGEFNSLLDKVVDYKDVRINNMIYSDIPVVERMNTKELFNIAVCGCIGAVIMYVVVCSMIILAPCPTM